jgi:hypothetical protein
MSSLQEKYGEFIKTPDDEFRERKFVQTLADLQGLLIMTKVPWISAPELTFMFKSHLDSYLEKYVDLHGGSIQRS